MTQVARRLVLTIVLALVVVAVAEATEWAWLGVRIRDLSEQEMDEISARHGISEGYGAVIVDVIEGGPAAQAGLKNGDIIVAFEDRPVVDTQTLQRLVAAAPVNRDSRVVVLRTSGRRPLPVRLAPMPRAIAGERVASEFGFAILEPSSADTATRVASAPAVSFVARGGPAERAGLEVGDVLLQVNEQAVVSRDAAREALAEAGTGRPLRLTVRRGERHVSLTLAAR